jgi:hypothetical protein
MAIVRGQTDTKQSDATRDAVEQPTAATQLTSRSLPSGQPNARTEAAYEYRQSNPYQSSNQYDPFASSQPTGQNPSANLLLKMTTDALKYQLSPEAMRARFEEERRAKLEEERRAEAERKRVTDELLREAAAEISDPGERERAKISIVNGVTRNRASGIQVRNHLREREQAEDNREFARANPNRKPGQNPDGQA